MVGDVVASISCAPFRFRFDTLRPLLSSSPVSPLCLLLASSPVTPAVSPTHAAVIVTSLAVAVAVAVAVVDVSTVASVVIVVVVVAAVVAVGVASSPLSPPPRARDFYESEKKGLLMPETRLRMMT